MELKWIDARHELPIDGHPVLILTRRANWWKGCLRKGIWYVKSYPYGDQQHSLLDGDIRYWAAVDIPDVEYKT